MSTVAFSTLGCTRSFAETSTFEREFLRAGFTVVPPTEEADIYVVNTCSVTAAADKKGRNFIGRLHRISPEARIVVTGCQAQLRADSLADMPGVWAVVGSDYKNDLLRIATAATLDRKVFVSPIEESRKYFSAYSTTERTRAFLKVQDGCDYHCTYCTVPPRLQKSWNRPAPLPPPASRRW